MGHPLVPHINIVYMQHDLTEKENVRQLSATSLRLLRVPLGIYFYVFSYRLPLILFLSYFCRASQHAPLPSIDDFPSQV